MNRLHSYYYGNEEEDNNNSNELLMLIWAKFSPAIDGTGEPYSFMVSSASPLSLTISNFLLSPPHIYASHSARKNEPK